MRLCTFDRGDGAPRPGLVRGEGERARVLDLASALALDPLPRCLRGLLEAFAPDALAREAAALAWDAAIPLADSRLLAPVPRPPKITAVGLNYRDHAAEQGKPPPERPMLFAKARTSVSGPLDAIRFARAQEKVDFEVELCLVVGKPGFRVPRERAREHLLGYTVAIDVSDRAAQQADKQFYRAKSYPSFCPVGPFVVTPDELDARALALETRLNGAVMQSGSTADLVFGVEELVEYVSAVAPLEVGDLLLTGTPAGVGVFRDPPVFLRPGDRLRCAIAGIGALDLAIEAD
jgi:2-keto-4-pentenoate hydratase/2-oxohepta-3-ene-1,7-dioic acid hydratase in catechol pathway